MPLYAERWERLWEKELTVYLILSFFLFPNQELFVAKGQMQGVHAGWKGLISLTGMPQMQ